MNNDPNNPQGYNNSDGEPMNNGPQPMNSEPVNNPINNEFVQNDNVTMPNATGAVPTGNEQPMNNAVDNQSYETEQQPKKTPKKAIIIALSILGGFIALGVLIFFIISASSEKLVCKSPEGDITIMYTEKTLTGYTANGIEYDLDGQRAIAEQIGVTAYLDQFKTWFSTNTSGSCE